MRKLKTKKVKFGELEDNVMFCVWELSHDDNENLVDVRSIMKLLKEHNPDREYVYTTIHTTCLRLCKKKRLEKVQIKNKYYYKSAESKNSAFKNDLQSLANKYFKGCLKTTVSTVQSMVS